MTRGLLITALTVSILFNVGFVIGLNQSRRDAPGESQTDAVELVSKRLDLSPTQRAQFAELRRDFARDWEQLQTHAALIRQDLAEQLGDDDPDMDRVEELLREGMEVDRQLRMAAAARFRDFAGELRPEQRRRLGGMMRGHRPPPFNGHDPASFMRRFDLNKDGVLDEDEKREAWRQLRERRRPGDMPDGPGRFDERDWRGERGEFGRFREAAVHEMLLRRFDVNGDGVIDEEEAQALVDWLNDPSIEPPREQRSGRNSFTPQHVTPGADSHP